MGHNSNWSNDSQAHTQMVILESQNEVKQAQIANLKEDNNLLQLKIMELKDEIDRLNTLINTLTANKDVHDVMDKFK